MDSKVIGSAFPQVEGLYSNEFPYVDTSSFLRKKITQPIKFPPFKLKYRAKLTDLLSCNITLFPSQALISPKFLKILINFISYEFQIFDVIVIDKQGNHLPYKIIHQYQHKNDYVDYSKTVFELTSYDFTVSPPTSEKREFQVGSFEEFEIFNRSHKKSTTCAKKFYLKEDSIQLDFFTIIGPSIWVINERVAEALIQEKITGLSIIPLKQGEDFCSESVVKKAIK